MLRIAIVIAFATVAVPAAADTLLVISDDPAFRSAVVTAVAPDQMSVRVADVPTPSLETIAQASRDASQREHADAAAWLLAAGQGATLIVYDRNVDRVLVRSLPYTGKLDAAQAAEAARITRTMLRALRVVDDAAPARPPPSPKPPIVMVAAPPPPPAPTRLAIDLDGGVRVRGPGATATPVGTLGVIWRPDQLGVALAVRYAPPAELDGMFVGEISDHSIAALARLPLHAAPRIDVIATAGLAVHRIVLEGTLDGMTQDDHRLDPAARIGVAGSVALNPTIGLGISMSADWLLRRQTYETTTTTILTVPVIQVGFGVVLIARIL
jgi:hypothetical protein